MAGRAQKKSVCGASRWLVGQALLCALECILLTLVLLSLVRDFFPGLAQYIAQFLHAHPLWGTFDLGVLSEYMATWVGSLCAALESVSFVKPEACASIFSLIGLTGSIAWLVTASDRKVLGVPIGQLLRWAYPLVIISYFFCFLPMVFLGVFAANQKIISTTLLALAGTIIQFSHLMFINNRMLLSADKREHIVYAYYMKKLEKCPINDKKFSPPAILHMTAECARLLLTEELRINSIETLELWHEAVQKLRLNDPEKGMDLCSLQDRERNNEDTPYWILKATDAWYILLRDPLSNVQKESAAQKLLYRLAHKKDADFFTYMALMAGLVLTMFRLNEQKQDGGKRLWADFLLILGALKDKTPANMRLLVDKEEAQAFRYELTRLQQRLLIGAFGMATALFDEFDSVTHGPGSFSLFSEYCKKFANEIPPTNLPNAALMDLQNVDLQNRPIEPTHIQGTPPDSSTGGNAGQSVRPGNQSEHAMEEFSNLCTLEEKPQQTGLQLSAWLEILLWFVEWGYRKEHGISYSVFTDLVEKKVLDFYAVDDYPYFRSLFLRKAIQKECNRMLQEQKEAKT